MDDCRDCLISSGDVITMILRRIVIGLHSQ
nr:MAG TPA: hypothetical protein [Caudoviricetes sp.]